MQVFAVKIVTTEQFSQTKLGETTSNTGNPTVNITAQIAELFQPTCIGVSTPPPCIYIVYTRRDLKSPPVATSIL